MEFFATAAQVLPTLAIALILEMRGALDVMKRRANWIPAGGRIVSWLLLPFVLGEFVALLMVGVGDHGPVGPKWWLITAYAVVGSALALLTWFVAQFGWLVTIDMLFNEADDAPGSDDLPSTTSASGGDRQVPRQQA